jgi:dCTP deaminase
MSGTAEQTITPARDAEAETRSGIFPAQGLRSLIEAGLISAEDAILPEQVQPASIDLRLGGTAYRVPASSLPGTRTVEDKLSLFAEEKIDLDKGAVLETGKVYLVRLQESLTLRKRMSGVANPKSSTGRLDVFCRVITDHSTEFDQIAERYTGPLWLEIAPRSFNVKVRRGSRLSQIRLKRGTPPSSDAFVRRLHEEVRIVRDEEGPADVKDGAIALSVDVMGDPATGLIGYKARKTREPIDLDLVNHYAIADFWDEVHRPKSGGLVLKTDEFHILATKETVCVPADLAGDMIAYDTLVGEFRVHYAGFFDPGFGYNPTGPQGTKIVLEVRSHEVPFLLEHGQMVGRVVVERLTEPTEKPYGAGIGSSYQGQGLTLGKHFKRG